jgi:toxin ParE1/3/4
VMSPWILMSALDLVFSRRAQIDLEDLLAFTERLWGTNARDTFAQQILQRFNTLIQFPYMGSPRPEYGKGRRGYIIDSYLVLYTVTETDVRVARIVHTKRDIDRALGE